MNEWVSVEEQLPPPNVKVLVCFAWYDGKNMNHSISFDRTIITDLNNPKLKWAGKHAWKITHWMRLPELPQGGKKQS